MYIGKYDSNIAQTIPTEYPLGLSGLSGLGEVTLSCLPAIAVTGVVAAAITGKAISKNTVTTGLVTGVLVWALLKYSN